MAEVELRKFCEAHVFPRDFYSKQLHVDDIQNAGAYKDCYFYAVIETAHPVHEGGPRKKTCKLVVQQDGKKIHAFFFGDIADMCAPAKVGDGVLVRDPFVGIAPGGGVHRFQLELGLTWSDFTVWFIPAQCDKENIRSSETFGSKLQKKPVAIEWGKEDGLSKGRLRRARQKLPKRTEEDNIQLPRKLRKVQLGPRAAASVAHSNVRNGPKLKEITVLIERLDTASTKAKKTKRSPDNCGPQEKPMLRVSDSRNAQKTRDCGVSSLETADVDLEVAHSNPAPSGSQDSWSSWDSCASSVENDDNAPHLPEAQHPHCQDKDSGPSPEVPVPPSNDQQSGPPGTPSGHFSPPTIVKSLEKAGSTASTSKSTTGTQNTVQQCPSPDPLYVVPTGYTKLADLKEQTVVSIFGIVKLFKPPWKSRGTDVCSVALLTDPSLPQSAEETGLECVMFQPTTSKLPQILSIGNVVRFHRVKVSRYRGRLQAMSTKGFAAMVFDHDPNIEVSEHTARVSTESFTFSAEDKEMVCKLKDFYASHQAFFKHALCCKLENITPSIYCDIVCQVLTIAQHPQLDCVVLRVADGTTPQYKVKQFDESLFRVISAVPNTRPSVDVFLFGEHEAAVRQLRVNTGAFVKVHDIHAQVEGQHVGMSLLDELNPVLELCVHRGPRYGRGITILPANSAEVQALLV